MEASPEGLMRARAAYDDARGIVRTRRAAYIAEMRGLYAAGWSLADLGRELGLSRSRVLRVLQSEEGGKT